MARHGSRVGDCGGQRSANCIFHCMVSKYSAMVSARSLELTSSPERFRKRPCFGLVPLEYCRTELQSPLSSASSNQIFLSSFADFLILLFNSSSFCQHPFAFAAVLSDMRCNVAFEIHGFNGVASFGNKILELAACIAVATADADLFTSFPSVGLWHRTNISA